MATLDLSRRVELEWLARLVADIRSAAARVEPLVVGALARDLLLHHAHGLHIERATTDADFALAVANWDEFASIREALLAGGAFSPHRNVAHKLQHKACGWIDVVPFGAIERSDGTIAWPPSGDEVMEVIGYQEAALSAVTVALPQGQVTQTVSLPMLAVLKVLAWNDRHRFTQGKDAADLGLILRSYLDAGNLERLYEDHAEVINEQFDFEPASGWLAGRDARQVLITSTTGGDRRKQIVERLDAILTRQLVRDGPAILLSQSGFVRLDTAVKVIEAFRRGLVGAPSP